MIDWWIIEKSLEGTLTPAEKEQLQCWLEESLSNRLWYEKVRTPQEKEVEDEQFNLWRKTFEHELNRRQRLSGRKILRRWGSVAAIVILALTGGYVYWNKSIQPVSVPGQFMAYREPDRNKVRLYTSGGEMVDLSALEVRDTLLIDGIKVAKNQSGVSYEKGDRLEGKSLHVENQIEVPRGAEFCLTLADGTVVWLNADTRLRYPVDFTGNSREVEVEGEAYFQVKRDEVKPFIVHFQGMEVTVLGTEFNVNTRQIENIQTTLVQGKVQVSASPENPVILQPGEMASTNIRTGKTRTTLVNVQKYVAWRYGKYCFEEATVEEILNELALWYDVEVEFQDEKLRKERFSGYLSRGDSITSILNKIEQTTYIHFSVVQNRVIVRR